MSMLYTREDLSKFCTWFKFSYELKLDAEYSYQSFVGRSSIARGYVKLKNDNAKRHKFVNVTVLPGNDHITALGLTTAIVDRCRTEDELITDVFDRYLLKGCRMKCSNWRTVYLPAAGSLAELEFKLIVTNHI